MKAASVATLVSGKENPPISELLQPRGHFAARIGKHHQRHALPDRHGGQRNDDRRQAEPGDQHAIEETGGKADGDGKHQASDHAVGDSDSHDGACNTCDGPKRQIDAARQNHQELAQRHKRQRQGVDAKRANVKRRESLFQDDVNYQEAEKDQDRPVLADKGKLTAHEGHQTPSCRSRH